MSNRLGPNQNFNGNRIQGVGTPINPGDGVPKSFIRYDWPTGCVGMPLAAEIFSYLVVPVVFTLPINLVGSLGRAITAPAASAVWTLYRIPNGSTTTGSIATMTFATGSITASFNMSSALTLAINDMLYWVAPSTQDTALSDVGILVAGGR